ncbi:MAG: YbhB/YbcL family Raf kinase inhibitor-like protein [Gemmatimonadaceae bacterium]
MPFTLSSSAFASNGSIPSKYTCEGEDISPPLEWSRKPDGTRSLVLIVDDPDAPDPAKPQRVYVHWVVYNISDSTTRIAENAARSGLLPHGAMQGFNDWGKPTYGGPCPPIGRHRYFFKLYALDSALNLKRATKAQVEEAMEGHVIGLTELVGTYAKKGS